MNKEYMDIIHDRFDRLEIKLDDVCLRVAKLEEKWNLTWKFVMLVAGASSVLISFVIQILRG